MSSGRPLLAARTSSGEATKEGHSPGSNRPPPGAGGAGRPKRTLIESACSACRRRKSRCDGIRPTCSRCQNLRTDCVYEAEEGESRWSALRRRNQVLEAERDQLRELMAFVQSRSEQEAQDLFHRIRQSTYEDLFVLLRQIKEGTFGMPSALASLPHPSTSPQGVEQRLPPIQTILDAPGRGMTPAHLVHQPQSMSSDEGRTPSGDLGTVTPGHLPQHRAMLDTLEPSLRQQVQQHPPPMPTLSSEDSTGSIGSGSIGSISLDPSRPYHTP